MRAHTLTVRLAKQNESTYGEGVIAEHLMPEDLDEVLYDAHKSPAFTVSVFTAIFSRRKREFRRAVKWYFIWLIILVVTVLILSVLLGLSGPSGWNIVLITAATYVVFWAGATWWTLTRIRFVVCRRVFGEYHQTWPFLPKKESWLYTDRLQQSSYETPFWGPILYFAHFNIRTDEQDELINGWSYARYPEMFRQALETINSAKPPVEKKTQPSGRSRPPHRRSGPRGR